MCYFKVILTGYDSVIKHGRNNSIPENNCQVKNAG